MSSSKKQRAVQALLTEYRNVVVAMNTTIKDVSYANLTTVVDASTTDENCQSIQTILTHVVSSGYAYAGYIRKNKKIGDDRPGKVHRTSIAEYLSDLENLLLYTEQTFENIEDDELEEFDQTRKIKTSWGQSYDIEQMMEHAVVHVLRHRRQIEKFKKKLEVL
ncbi:DinB family protein [Flavobacterium sp. CYK-55]|uniref:DinB family protein n=1 Tax=Flavobacterium sp. CYK-55 TaxID=2835529 RepID=UPI001BD0F340|nr:DinB family protein [Flavobacterium sp. CYK-55]MBS7787294.1 DinB family protein [Flavobacterium sp. CYK-55]